jgi:hypothetical protein
VKAVERGMSIGEVIAAVRADLARKFLDGKWVRDWSLSGRGFRSYVRDEDWLSPLPPPPAPPANEWPDTDAGEDKATIAERNLVALLRDPDVEPDRKAAAKQKWLERNPGRSPPWDRPS